ncbi:unnamed protein product [Urochloa decumbens]|uniref:Uncharacterized protein n=1 Tax=Urochloa decumbens TaxID=240449 RepID=A0ABC8VAK2_9POAL
MDDEEGLKTPLQVILSAMKPSLAEVVRVHSLLLALLFACDYGRLAAYNLAHIDHPCQEQEPPWLVQCYDLEGEDAEALWRRIVWCSALQAAAAATALPLLLLLALGRPRWPRALRALAPALLLLALGRRRRRRSSRALGALAPALLLLARGRRRRRGALRALALVALAATAANHVMYAKVLSILRASNNPGQLSLAEPVAVFLAAALDLLGFVAFLTGAEDEYAGRRGKQSPVWIYCH